MFCFKPSSFPFRHRVKTPKMCSPFHKSWKVPIFRFLSPLEQEASFTPRPRQIGPLASRSSLGEFTSRCLSLLSGGPDVMPVSWVAKHSETHPAPGETILESSSITARRKHRTALSSLTTLSQRASC